MVGRLTESDLEESPKLNVPGRLLMKLHQIINRKVFTVMYILSSFETLGTPRKCKKYKTNEGSFRTTSTQETSGIPELFECG